MADGMELQFYDTLSRKKRVFAPIDPAHVRLYACGPTVYDTAHIGNGRTLVTFDLLFRLLRQVYGAANVVYVRNITDVDDKINTAAQEQGVVISEITTRTTKAFHADMATLNCLAPTHEPRATEYISQMIDMISKLIELGHGYEAQGHVLFSVPSMADYGKLSGHSKDELIAGARVEVAPYKRDSQDFVLWKPSTGDEPGWDSPWGFGRPGWHIECSVMSAELLGETFDIHGGGIDLVFPHHENEIAQSTCVHSGAAQANFWMHGGYLQVEGEKMSKSLGNFHTVHDLLKSFPGEALRLQLLMSHYRQPLNWTREGAKEARRLLDKWVALTSDVGTLDESEIVCAGVLTALGDDLNVPKALAEMHELASSARDKPQAARALKASANLLGLLEQPAEQWDSWRPEGAVEIDAAQVEALIEARNQARHSQDFAKADTIRDQLEVMGVVLEDTATGTTWHDMAGDA